jgi:X-X-X-Leu-X-X-Gly heptad repeat protein
MLIRTQLRLAAVLPAVLALLISCILWSANLAVDRAKRDADLAETVLRFNFELNILTQEYVLYGGRRIEIQLRKRHQSMGELLARLPAREAEERELIDVLKSGQEDLGSFYDLLLVSKPEARQQLVGALLVKAQEMRAKTWEFATIQHQYVFEFQRQADTIVVTATIVLGVCSMILMALMAQRLVRGLGQLEDGVQQVAAGDFEHQIRLTKADELGSLASSFNRMIHQLRDSYTSIDTLTAEIVRRQKAEAELQLLNAELEERVHLRTTELEAANKELEAFSYSVSHDLAAPLRGIDGFSRMIEEDYADKLDERGRDYLQRIRLATQRMHCLIDDLLGLARITRNEMHRQIVDVSALAQDVAAELTRTEPARTVEFSIAAGLRVYADPSLFRIAMDNLLRNSMEVHRPASGCTN